MGVYDRLVVVFKDCLLILVIVNDFAALVGLRGSLKVYQTARVFPVFKDMHNSVGRPLTLIAGVVTVVAATVIAFPLMYRNARAAFEQVDANLVYAARTLGMSEIKIFWKVVIPSAGPGILSGTILTFARAMGEYGATSMLAGNIPGKTGTISQKIAMVIQDGDYGTAGFWVVVVMLIAFLVVVVMNLLGSGENKHKKRW